MSEQQKRFRGLYLGVAVENYRRPDNFPTLPGATEQIKELGDHLAAFGYERWELADPTVEVWWRTQRKLKTPPADGRADATVIAWSGHAETDAGALRLILHDTSATDGDETADPGNLAVAALQSADQVLILLDTCYSGTGVPEALRRTIDRWDKSTAPPGTATWLGVLASAKPSQRAEGEGVLIQEVNRLLTHGPKPGKYRAGWSVRTRGITGWTLMQTLVDEWPEELGQKPLPAAAGQAAEIFRNPRWRPQAGPEPVEHLVLAAQGGEYLDEGWFFSGRRRVLSELVAWLRAGRPGIRVVTGPAGCGKSAVVGRIVTLSDPARRAELLAHSPLTADDPDPGEGSVDASVFLRGATLDSATKELAKRLGLAEPSNPSALVAEIAELDRPPVVVLDGLDEAVPGQAGLIRTELVEPLGRVALVLLATRSRAFQRRGEASDDGLVGEAVTFDLGREPETESDIARYLRRRLAAGGVAGDLIERAVPLVAARAARGAGGFLFARIVAGQLGRGLLDGDALEERLAENIGAALDQDLESGPSPVKARELLRALAWAEGPGLPAEIWAEFATALSSTGAEYGPEEIDDLLGNYGRYLIEDQEDGHAVYRLYHREFVLYLRADTLGKEQSAAHRLIDTAIRLIRQQTDGGRRPANAHPYLQRYLPNYAVVAGPYGIAALRRLAEANPDAYLPDLAMSLNNLANRLAEVGQRQAALQPAQEAADTYRTLAEANPDAYLPNLAMSLNNLANRLAEVGKSREALEVWTEAIEATINPATKTHLRAEQAAHLLRRENTQDALHILIRLLQTETPAPSVVFRAHAMLREQYRSDPEQVENAWRALHDDPPPKWLQLSERLITETAAWINTESWTESRDHLKTHTELLTSPDTDAVLDEFALLAPQPLIDQHRKLLQAAKEHGIDNAYRPFLLFELLHAWLAADDWETSRIFLTEHPELLDPEALHLLDGSDNESSPRAVVHRALLMLISATEDIETSYRALTERQHLDRLLNQMLTAQNSTGLTACALLEGLIYGEALPSMVHQALALVMDDPESELPAEMIQQLRQSAADADVETRNRLAAQIAGLLPALPQPTALNQLLRLVLDPSSA